VLPNHAPMIVLLRGGTISITEGGRVTDRLFVSGGFAEITPERCTVLADEAVPTSELSRAEGERRLAEAQADYDKADKMDVAALDIMMDRMQSARAMVEAASA
jgi:F-type H+-transporting ATPase subunit epsilon